MGEVSRATIGEDETWYRPAWHPLGGERETSGMQSNSTEVTTSPPRRPGWRASTTAISLTMTILTSLLLACAPAATPSPAAPAPAAAPAAAPARHRAAAPAAAPAAAAPARSTPKGSITVVVGEEPLMLAGYDSTASYNNQVMRNVDEALLNRDPKTNEMVGELATKWEQTNPTTWRFPLRQGVKFHDGSPFNAESAAFGINYSGTRRTTSGSAAASVPSSRPRRSTSTPWTW